MNHNKEQHQGESEAGLGRPAAHAPWFAFSYFVASAAALAVLLLRVPDLLLSWWALLALAVASLVGLLLTHGLRRDLVLAEQSLDRMIQGVPVAELPTHRGQPSAGLLTRVAALAARERRLGHLRERWAHQAGAAAAQEERNRLARDLHDSIKQQLFSINVSAAAAQARWANDPAGARAALDDARRSAQEALVEMNALLQQLRPVALEARGLAEALREQCEALAYRTGAHVAAEVGDLPAGERLPPDAQEALLRIGQEALSNVARHARATNVRVRLYQHADVLRLEVADDGQGFDPAEGAGRGLANIRERAAIIGGTVALESAPGTGTTLRVDVPLAAAIAPVEAEVAGVIVRWSARTRPAARVIRVSQVVRAFAWPAFMLAVYFGVYNLSELSPAYRSWREPSLWLLEAGWIVLFAQMVAEVALAAWRQRQTWEAAGELALIGGADRRAALRWRRDALFVQVELCFQHLAIWAFAVFLGLGFDDTFGNLVLWAALACDALFGVLVVIDLIANLRLRDALYRRLAPRQVAAELDADAPLYSYASVNVVWLLALALLWGKVGATAWSGIIVAAIGVWLIASAIGPLRGTWWRRRARGAEMPT